MKLILNSSQDPYYNLALEEYLLLRRADLHPLFLLWQNRPTVVVGRNQNTLAEINHQYIQEHDIAVVRRLSGGGAVYHDLGNLNFTFILEQSLGQGFDFARYTRPVIKTLRSLGVEAEDNGRNDITIGGKKFSGNAQCRYHNSLLHHGTLLFNSRLEDMVEALTPDIDKLQSKGIASVRSRVTNISEHLPAGMSLEDFQRELIHQVFDEYGNREVYELSEQERHEAEELRRQRYISWEWNYGRSPACNLSRAAFFPWGQMEVQMDIQQGIIQLCRIYGDFFAERDIMQLCTMVEGSYYRKEDVQEKLHDIDLSAFIPDLTLQDFLELLFP